MAELPAKDGALQLFDGSRHAGKALPELGDGDPFSL